MKLQKITCLLIFLIFLFTSHCSWFRVKTTSRVPTGEQALPAKTASLQELISLVNGTAERIRTLRLTVIYQLTGGSINTGEISNYRETDGFILLEKPGHIRLIGQAFKVKVFDMVSDGTEFRIHVPPKTTFMRGLNQQEIKPRKDLPVNLRPQHIFEALAFEPLELRDGKDLLVPEEDQEGKRKFYILNIVSRSGESGRGLMKRKVWIDRFDLSFTRQKIFNGKGQVLSDVSYSEFKDVEGGRYPKLIDFKRPQENYSLRLRVGKAVINEPLKPEQFVLEQPKGAQFIDFTKESL